MLTVKLTIVFIIALVAIYFLFQGIVLGFQYIADYKQAVLHLKEMEKDQKNNYSRFENE